MFGYALLEAISVHAAVPLDAHPAARDARVVRVLAHIDAHWSAPLSRADLARLAGLSPSRFHAVFRRATGFAPLEYMMAIRLQRAGELLETTSQTVSEIASACGFATVYYFSRCFTAHKRMTPTAYRSQFLTAQ
ncbi:MAG: hypothetical protein A3K19_03435 [Lentisphaerae bacterium RIFOXYB12_FULL_65_16]|nr:MAG: hypothetical protein A3K18_31610 [Lentisphaerae bacterium RIFOXYA12_64_32]OGV92018.1 MAG: hypothetical protein A3K19_03435 [Lentisphaerae bacterium RIFOXYB12_FULL_65_16]